MINVTTVASLDGPRKNFGFPSNYTGEDEKITDRQRHILLDLIDSKISDETEREHHLSQIDGMTSTDAEDLIFYFLTTKWR